VVIASPYANAPTLPEGERVDIRTLVTGEWIELEIGPGRGMFLLERALAVPHAGLIGLEIRRKWAAIVDARLKAKGLGSRARVFAEDALYALGRLGPDASVRRVFLLFPDPWWKKRHQKRLVMGDVFLEQIARLLEPRGELFVETDVEERADQYEAAIVASERFAFAGDDPSSPRMVDHTYDARTNREKRAIADGLPVYRMRFVKA
jgi:tRNA (guanine-N7-)-methyltransferase